MDLKNKKIIFLLIAIILGIIIYLTFFQKKALTPTEKALADLSKLEETSLPVTTTTEERLNILKKLEKASIPVKYTEEQKLKMLESLNQ